MNSPKYIQSLKKYYFEMRLEQRTPGVVEALSKLEAQEFIEAGLVEFGDKYYSSTKIQWLDEKEVE